MTWKVGDWCFYEFKLCQIKELRADGFPNEFSDGWIRSGYNEAKIFPLSLEIKRISEIYESWSNTLHKEGSSNLNYPDIHRWLVSHWAKTCEIATVSEENLKYEELDAFCKEILLSSFDGSTVERCKRDKTFLTSFGIHLYAY